MHQRVVDFIELKRDDFEPFMEDEEKFEHVRRYLRRFFASLGLWCS